MIIVSGNTIIANGKNYKCAIGKNGFAANKIEGDNKTPIGEFYLREVFYRADKISAPQTKLKTTATQKNFGWCDDVNSAEYNKFITLPHPARHENLWREDNLYDIVVVIGYNDSPPIKGKGSAIFMHIAKPEYQGTEGCIALEKNDLLEILQNTNNQTKLKIKEF